MGTYVVIYSGGIDSTTLVYELLKGGSSLHCLSIDYGQRHRRELEAAQSICADLRIPHEVADLRTLSKFLGSNSQTDFEVAVPEGHYTEESMKQTIVPNRNMLMLSVALSWAVSINADGVAYGAHAGDHAIYPDCRPEFVESMQRAAALCDWQNMQLLAPYVSLSKEEIVRKGLQLGVPYEKTWSCYKGGALHCGKCGTCFERKEAFELVGVKDPTQYQA